jgi:uncharacterized membrane protein YphA (DoxX/SURF4 family)
VRELARLALAGVFLAASLPKVAEPAAFAQTVANYRLLPDAAVTLTALALPWLELVAGVALLLGLFSDSAALLLALVAAGLAAAVGTAQARGLTIHCGCFGAGGDTLVPWPGLALDLVLLALALYSWRAGPGRWSLDGWLASIESSPPRSSSRSPR